MVLVYFRQGWRWFCGQLGNHSAVLTSSFLTLVCWSCYQYSRCSDCIDIQPEWNRLAADWDGHLHGQVAQVDCDDQLGHTQVICDYFQIQVGDLVHRSVGNEEESGNLIIVPWFLPSSLPMDINSIHWDTGCSNIGVRWIVGVGLLHRKYGLRILSAFCSTGNFHTDLFGTGDRKLSWQ